jgi:hypothetical protein
MTTDEYTGSREAQDFYIAKINSLIESGRESLISGLVAEFDQLDRVESYAIRKAS